MLYSSNIYKSIFLHLFFSIVAMVPDQQKRESSAW